MSPRPTKATSAKGGARSHPRTTVQQHRAWLELLDLEGPFLSVPVLKRAWPQGMDPLTGDERTALLTAKRPFDTTWDTLDRDPTSESARAAYRVARDAFVETTLRDVAGWGECYLPASGARRTTSPDGSIQIVPTGELIHGDVVGALVRVVEPGPSLRDQVGDGWATSELDRMEALLRASGVRIGVVTDGRWWALVHASKEEMPASGITDALTWVEEPTVRDAFLSLIRRPRLLAERESHRLPTLFADSVAAAEEVTESLGLQVRRAVELLVQAFGEAAADAHHRGRPTPLPSDAGEVYQAAVTVMMRVVFLLFAQERGLLPESVLFTQGYGLAGQLDELVRRAAAEHEESLDDTVHTWHRLLSTSLLLHRGSSFEDLRVPSYGGSLFDPSRFPWLDARTPEGGLAVRVSDRIMLHVLRSVQHVVVGGEARRISFRDIDVEQIGYVYEGLLGYTCETTDEIVVGLLGRDGAEPEIPLATLEGYAAAHRTPAALAAAVLAFVKADQPSAVATTATALTKALGTPSPEAEPRLRAVAPHDLALRERLRPFVGVIRTDLRGKPMVVSAGGLLVVETPSRRNAGAHYTPRSLAEEVIEHALAPLVYSPGPHQTLDTSRWGPRTSSEILDLKVADIACGSGAFLVAAARYLAARVVEAWHAEGADVGFSAHDLQVRALRQVVAQCLYGADINPMAVEMCKLSLWLVSLDRALPFSFVDDKVLLGNSLLGLTSLRQLEELHIAPASTTSGTVQEAFAIGADNELVERLDIRHTVARAMSLRRQLANVIEPSDPMRTGSAKRRQLDEFHRLVARLKHIADGVIAAGLAIGGRPGPALNVRYAALRSAVATAYPRDGASDPALLDAIIAEGLTPTVATDYERWQPLHWCLEVPDVMDRGGFDAIVGNPPYIGGTRLSSAYGQEYREWLVNILAGQRPGAADLSAYFLLRFLMILAQGGNLGLIATNTLAQGITRAVGLDWATKNGLEVVRAEQSARWPTGSASLEFSKLWATVANVPPEGPRICEGQAVAGITSLLEPVSRVRGTGSRLRENSGQAFAGVKIFGSGFVLDRQEAAMIAEDGASDVVIRQYPHGKNDINGSPSLKASRFVIDFGEMSMEQAKRYPRAFARVEKLVRPQRMRAAGTYPQRVRSKWWLYEAPRIELTRALGNCHRAIVIVQTSSTQAAAFVEPDQVFDQKLVVFAPADYRLLAVLNSSAHRLWAIRWGSTRTADPVYTPSDVFETFPRPEPTTWLDQIGQTLDDERREIMLRRQLGLTKLYNLVNDPGLSDAADADVARMRAIHVELDEAVLAAYGWSDVPLEHGFHTYRQMTRWTVSPAARVEILDRLLEENHRRAVLQGETPTSGDDSADHVGGEDEFSSAPGQSEDDA